MTTILVIDDEMAILDLVSTILEDEGYVVRTARHGREGLEMLRQQHEQPISLVLCDLMMPIMDGCELYHTLRRDESLNAMPFIMMSAVPKDSARLKRCGVPTSISKPFDITRLASTVRDALEHGTDPASSGTNGRGRTDAAP